MNRVRTWIVLAMVCGMPLTPDALAEPPTCTVHYFDWYVASGPEQLAEMQKRWTYQVDWERLGISPEDIGHTVHYYEVQCQKIRDAGFDGIHFEWTGSPVQPQFSQALLKTGVPMAMFYDMEIRFHDRPSFITPTDEFAETFVNDVALFYATVPRGRWLRDRNGCLPIVVYGYQFDRQVTDPAAWDRFYRAIISGVEKKLGEQVVFHWTNNGSPQQMYGFQHFPEIQSYIFNEVSQQTPVDAHSVTFVVHYDDLGVSFARNGPRPTRWIRNDVRYLEEALWLARHSDPDLVFNYGWNELYEGEHLLPDSLWGDWRYEVAGAMVKEIKREAKLDVPRALIIVDDFLSSLQNATAERAAILAREQQLLARLRSLAPAADVVLPGSGRDLNGYDIVFALNTVKDGAEETALATCSSAVVYANAQPGEATAMTRRFTDRATRPLPRPDLGPENEYVAIVRPVSIDLTRFPTLQYRCRNSAGTIFHIRYRGLTADGREVEAWLETSDTDDRQSGGKWLEGQANVAEIARQAAGEPIETLTRIEVILDDLENNGQFDMDLDYLRFVAADGSVGWEDPFDTIDDWTVHATFEGAPGGRERFAFSARQEHNVSVGHIDLRAVVSSVVPGPLDLTTRMIEPRAEVRVLVDKDFEGVAVPVLLLRDHACWLNTCTPTDDCWDMLFDALLKRTLNNGVSFGSYSFSVTRDGLTAATNSDAMLIGRQRLPVDRIRLVAPPELDQSLPQTLPTGYELMKLRVIKGQRAQIPFPDPDSHPPTITLLPGEVVEFVR